MSAFSGSKRACSAQIVFPAVENTLSLDVEEDWTHKYEKARHDSEGYVCPWVQNQAAGSDDVMVGSISR